MYEADNCETYGPSGYAEEFELEECPCGSGAPEGSCMGMMCNPEANK